MPLRSGELWIPVTDLENGLVLDWPQGTQAEVHYKICDEGECWLLDENKNRIAKWDRHHAPAEILSISTFKSSDYIDLKIRENGTIIDWVSPSLVDERWKPI